MATGIERLEGVGAALLPVGVEVFHLVDEGGKLRVLINSGLDGLFAHRKVEVAGAVFFEQCLAQAGAYLPVALQGIDVSGGDAAAQVAVDILDVFGLLAVDVARDVEVEVVLVFDFVQRHHAGVLWIVLQALVEGIDDFVDVLIPQAVFVAVLDETLAGVDHEDALAVMRILLVDDDDAGGDAGAVEQVGGQADDAFDVTLADQVAANIGLGAATEQHAVRQNAGAFTLAFERTHDVQQVGVIALFVGRDAKVLEALPGIVLWIQPGAPAFVGERWIGNHKIKGFEIALIGLEQRIGQGIALLDQRGRVVVQDHVHARQTGGGGILLLPVEGDIGLRLVTHLEQ